MKKRFVTVEPVSAKAKNRFVNIMNSFHSCEVEQEKDNLLFLASINRKYFMWLPKEGNEHWKIVK